MVKQKQKDDHRFKVEFDEGEFITLLLAVPTEAFVGMVSKSGLPTKQARELCQMFKEMKA